MNRVHLPGYRPMGIISIAAVMVFLISPAVAAGDREGIRQHDVLRHLGVPRAHLVRTTARGLDGLDVELIQRIADHLGVAYGWVGTSWSTVFNDLTGQHGKQPERVWPR
ncbi:hypothetical protein DSCA_64620 [Desulfosarcina alkanivorans]|uniref:Solute-binding protein family 3/N-terminal domain-containing protein n=1 Tax=Desulfosarcina alkanivorans TaxID=571177 RepID=A0A5K7YRT6_9BACT|nr:hypothetical protein [Desulfosarcina alkanivorans]BBO72532.1 hypothetical protein DSCA_64620 [Desulfosarcina alkanivorans]